MKYFLISSLLLLFSITSSAQGNQYPLESIIQKGHAQQVNCSAFSPDGKFLVTGSKDHAIKLWNLANGREIRSFNRHTDQVYSVVFSPDGHYILSASADNRVILFEVISGKVIHPFKIKKNTLMMAYFSPDGNKIMAMDNRNHVYVWAVDSGKLLYEMEKDYGSDISPSFFSSDGTKVIAYDDYQSFSVLNANNGDTIQKIDFDRPYSYSFSPNGKFIAVGSSHLFAKVFDSETGKELFHLKGNEEALCQGCNTLVAFSHNSKYVLSAGRDEGVHLWDTKNGNLIRSFGDFEDRIRHINFSPDDRYILIIMDDEIFVFDVKSGKRMFYSKSDLYDYYIPTFSPNSLWIATPSDNNTTSIWRLDTGKILKRFSGYLNKKRDDGLSFDHSNWFEQSILKYISSKTGFALTNDGKYLFRGNIDSTVLMMDIETGKIVKSFSGHHKVVYNYALSKDGKTLATAGGDRQIIFWDIASGKAIRKISAHRSVILDIRFSHDDQYLISGSWDGSMAIWEVSTGELIHANQLKDYSPLVVGFTPNDLYAIVGGVDKSIRFWEIDSQKEFRELVGHNHLMSDFTFSPDQKQVITSSWDGTVKVWDILTGMQLQKYQHEGSVYTVDYDPKGRFIASGSDDRTVTLWDPQSKKALHQLKGHSNSVTDVHFSEDGKTLVSCSVDGEIIVWDLSTFQEKYTYWQLNRTEWLAKTPNGYFDGTSKALNLIHYVSGNEVITLGALFEKYYTPGLLQRLSNGEQFEGSIEKLNQDIQDSPDVGLILMQNHKTGTDLTQIDSTLTWKESTFPLTVKVNSKGVDLEEIRIYNQGQLVVQQLYNQEINFRSLRKTQRNFEIELSNGLNQISVVAINKNRIESIPQKVNVTYQDIPQEVDLYLISIGINHYKNPSYKLRFAVNDAASFSESIVEGGDSLFHEINDIFIKDKDAVKTEISKVFEDVSKNAGVEDVFIFYYAGHGVMSESDDPEFYLVTQDVTHLYGDDKLLKEKAISATEIMEYSRMIKAEKQLFVLDACQSGGALNAFAKRGVTREKALAQLARSTGTFFLTASQDIQFANEVYDLKHGIFTYALLEALNGDESNISSDQKITIHELKSYVDERVPQLSEKYNGTIQYPTSYSFGQDFPIVVTD